MTADGRVVLCLRAQANAPLGIIEDALEERGVPWRYVDLWEEPALPGLDSALGLVVLGGAMNADEVGSFPWLKDVRELVADAIEADVPVLGVCLGAQILARAAGAVVHAGATHEIGFHPVKVVADDPVVAPFAEVGEVFQFHNDVCDLPRGAQLLAAGRQVDVQAFRVGQTAYGVQFHFEVTPAEIVSWCDEVGDEVLRAEWGTSREALLDQADRYLADQQRAGRAAAAAFLQIVASTSA